MEKYKLLSREGQTQIRPVMRTMLHSAPLTPNGACWGHAQGCPELGDNTQWSGKQLFCHPQGWGCRT